MMTQGVATLSQEMQARIVSAIQDFEDFNADNDPYGTHEFGAVDVAGEKVFFKVDAYDTDLQYGSPDPADPSVTTRVLTILLASEY